MSEILFPELAEVQSLLEQKIKEREIKEAKEYEQEVLLASSFLPLLKSKIVEDYLNSVRTEFGYSRKFTCALDGRTPTLCTEFSCVVKYHADDLVKWAKDQDIDLTIDGGSSCGFYFITCKRSYV